MTDLPPLRTHGVSFGRNGRMLVDDIDCTVAAGSLTALVGPNGAGKSTLLHLIASVEAPTSGTVKLGGADINRMRRRARAQFAALVEQQGETELDLSARDVVLLGRTPHVSVLGGPRAEDIEIALAALHRVGADSLSLRRFHELSGGERQRVLLARALAQEPTLLLLDEPTNHLDIRAQLHTLSLLRSLADEGMAVLAALHDLTLAARYADRVIVVDRGRVVAAGAPSETLTPELIQLVYGVRADVIPHPLDGTPLIAFSALDATAPLQASLHSGA